MNGPEPAQPEIKHRPAWISFAGDGTLCCGGIWTLQHAADLERQILSLPKPPAGRISCDVGAIEAMDTGGAWLLQRTLNRFEQSGCSILLNGLSADFATLMQTVARGWSQAEQLEPLPHPGWLARLGQFAFTRGADLLKALSFIGETASAFYSLVTPAHRIRWRVLLYNLQVDGLNALPIIGLLSFLMGIVIAYQGSEQLKTFGANIFIVDLVGISLLREIAPLLTAILVAGRSGSAYAAQNRQYAGNRRVGCTARARHSTVESFGNTAGVRLGPRAAVAYGFRRRGRRLRRHADRAEPARHYFQ